MLAVFALAVATCALQRAAANHAINNGALDASASVPAASVAIPLVGVGAALVLRRRAVLLGRVFLVAALLLAIYRFGIAAVAFASPAPLGLAGYHFPGLGAVAIVGRTAGFGCAAALAIGVGVALGAARLDRRSRLAIRIGATGLVLIALGVATDPDLIVGGFTSAVDSPLALPNFEAAATTLRLIGVGVCIAGAAIAGVAARERLRLAQWGDVRRPVSILGGTTALTLLLATGGYAAGIAALRPLFVVVAAVVLPCVLGIVGEQLAVIVPTAPAVMVARSHSDAAFETLAARVLAGARVAASLWAIALFVAFRESFDSSVPGLLLIFAAATSVAAVVAVVRRPLIDWRIQLGVEIALASALLFADGSASGPGHLFSGESSLGGPWPTVVVAGAGASGGLLAGGVAGLLVGVAKVAGVVASGSQVFAAQAQGLAGGVVGFIAIGLASGALLAALREAEKRIASARAREAVARRLHDGVLQALAIVKRRSTDDELVTLVDNADRDLRAFLDRGDVEGELDLEESVRRAVDECERRYGLTVPVVIDEMPRLVSSDVIAAVVGAVSEALTNVSKHSGVTAATVFAGVDDDNSYYVSVTDRGAGFDPSTQAKGRGLAGSVDGRMQEVGGSATVRPLKSGGTQVMMWLP